jgi:hypothetical protein
MVWGNLMDNSEFVQKAPEYYALGIAIGLADDPNARTIHQIQRKFAPGDPYAYFQKEPLVDEAFKILARHNVVDLIPDDFGPTLFQPKENIADWLESQQNPIPLFRKFNSLGNTEWLRRAIRSVNDTYDRLKIQYSDFSQDTIDVQWEPIPLNRSDPALAKAAQDLQNAITSIEQDNGYAANAPGEREYVLSSLKDFQKAIVERSEIYWLQVKTFALEPLARVVKRFGSAAVGIAASAARESIVDWLKTVFSKVVDWL